MNENDIDTIKELSSKNKIFFIINRDEMLDIDKYPILNKDRKDEADIKDLNERVDNRRKRLNTMMHRIRHNWGDSVKEEGSFFSISDPKLIYEIQKSATYNDQNGKPICFLKTIEEKTEISVPENFEDIFQRILDITNEKGRLEKELESIKSTPSNTVNTKELDDLNKYASQSIQTFNNLIGTSVRKIALSGQEVGKGISQLNTEDSDTIKKQKKDLLDSISNFMKTIMEFTNNYSATLKKIRNDNILKI